MSQPTPSNRPPRAAGGVPSPCISICEMDRPAGLCRGCHRTIDEITRWSAMADHERMAVWQQLPARRAQRAR